MARCNLAIIVPALNEEKTIENVITRIKEKGTVIVINDGSSDRTSEIAENSGAIVINHSFNKGYDEALNTGFKYAYESGFEYVNVSLFFSKGFNPFPREYALFRRIKSLSK